LGDLRAFDAGERRRVPPRKEGKKKDNFSRGKKKEGDLLKSFGSCLDKKAKGLKQPLEKKKKPFYKGRKEGASKAYGAERKAINCQTERKKGQAPGNKYHRGDGSWRLIIITWGKSLIGESTWEKGKKKGAELWVNG